MRLCIAGSRKFTDYDLLKQECDKLLEGKTDIEIISGMAKGADTLAIQYAKERGYPVLEYPAKWNVYGRGAGFVRNEQMAKKAHVVILFWDGRSPGTANMFRTCRDMKKPVKVVNY